MKSIFNALDNKQIIMRLHLLDENSKTNNSNFTAEMLFRQSLLELDIAFGKKDIEVDQVKKAMRTFLKNQFIKSLIYNDSQSFYRRKYPKEANQEQLKNELIQKINRIGNQGKHAIMNMYHPFWGKMTYQDWDYLVWNYIDNHLSNLGV